MKRTILVAGAAIIMQLACFSQDAIKLKTGEIIQSKILEVGQNDVKYKKFDNQAGPVYVVSKSDILNIVYENGTKDTFSESPVTIETPKEAPKAESAAESPKTVSPDMTYNRSKFLIGFNGVLPTGTWPATALSNMGSKSFLEGQGHTVKSFGFGVLIQMKIAKNISLFLDGNTYNYNILIGEQGKDVQTVWTVEESATHWDESGAPQIQYVHNLPTDVYFDMQGTGFRLGGKYYFLDKKVRPWVGAGFGFYEWQVNYCNKEKDKTYGEDKGYVTGFSALGGIDFELTPGIIISAFVDLGSPVANYKIEGLFYPQWDIDYNAHIMGTNRFGLTVAFDSGKAGRNKSR